MTDPRISAEPLAPAAAGSPAEAPPGEDTRQVEYALTEDDAATFYRYDAKLSPRALRKAGIPPWVWAIFLGVVVTVAVLIRLMVPHIPEPSFFDWVVIALAVYFIVKNLMLTLFGTRLTVRNSLKAARRNPRIFEPKTMTVAPEGLKLSSASGDSCTRWHALVWIIEHGEHVFFYLTETQALTVPKRAFADGRQFEDFVNTARRYHAAARRFVRAEGRA
jgi:YcxB-like protein